MSESAGPLNLDGAIGALAEHDQILIATDFDGTVAPISDHPDTTEADDRSMQALMALAGMPGVVVAIVSGRPHRDLVRLVPPGPILLIGEHGNDTGDTVEVSPLIREITPQVVEIAGKLDGSYVEYKNSSVSVHWRQATADATTMVDALQELAAESEVTLLRGKKLIELSVANRTKADAVSELSEGRDDVLFLGDDVTDETVFEAMGSDGVSVKVGEGPTSARYRVRDVSEVADLLEKILAQRAE